MECNERNTEKRYWIQNGKRFVIKEVWVASYADESKRACSYKLCSYVSAKDLTRWVICCTYSTCDLFCTLEEAESECRDRVHKEITKLQSRMRKLTAILAANAVEERNERHG